MSSGEPLSLYSSETVVEIDRDGEVLRHFGHMHDSWGFTGDSDEFYWQHGAHYLGDGHLLVSSRVDDHREETVVREYALDEGAEELREVWSFGEGEGVWAYILGEPRRLPGGNTLHNYGYDPRIREATPDGEVVWDLAFDTECTMGRMTVVEDLYALWQGEP